MSEIPDWNRIGRYLAGELTPVEAAEVRRWLDENATDAEVVRALDTATRGLAPSRPVDVEAALRKVKARPRTASAPVARTTASPPRVAFRLIAAATMLVAAGVYATWAHRGGRPLQSYATAVGQTDTVALAGASTVILGPASSLEVRGREVTLAGDAYFAIRESGSGYVVRVGDVTVRDIGTEFAIESTGDRVRVAVASGIVEVERFGTKITADSGDVADIGTDMGVRQDAFGADDLAWTQGRLVLRNATMRDVAARMRRWYGVELRVDDGLASRHFTGSFAAEGARGVAEAIALAIGAVVQQRGDTIELRAPRSSR